VKAHVAGDKENRRIGMRGSIIEELSQSNHGGVSAFTLLGSKGAKGDKHVQFNSIFND
jgi:hypothetical protein